MAIEKINFSYPKGSLQSVFDVEEMTALELASKTSKKVDECIELVNGVEQIAITATAIVDEMQLAQEQFNTENSDMRAQIVTDNQAFLATITTQAETTLTNTKNSMDLALSTYQTTANNTLATFTADINTAKDQAIAGMEQQIKDNVVTEVESMVTDGTLTAIINTELLANINQEVQENEMVVDTVSPLTAKLWCEVVGETTIEINGESMLLVEI